MSQSCHANSTQPSLALPVIFKTAILVCKCICSTAPAYLHELCISVESVRGHPQSGTALTDILSCQQSRHQSDSRILLSIIAHYGTDCHLSAWQQPVTEHIQTADKNLSLWKEKHCPLQQCCGVLWPSYKCSHLHTSTGSLHIKSSCKHLKTFLFAVYWYTYIQHIRGFTTMRYINLRFTYLLTHLLTYCQCQFNVNLRLHLCDVKNWGFKITLKLKSHATDGQISYKLGKMCIFKGNPKTFINK